MPPPELEKLLQQLVKERILRPDFDPRRVSWAVGRRVKRTVDRAVRVQAERFG